MKNGESNIDNFTVIEKKILKYNHCFSIVKLLKPVIHDLNNLLSVIIGRVELAEYSKDINEKDKFLSIIGDTSQRIKFILESLTSFSVSGLGHDESNLFHVKTVIEDILLLLNKLLEKAQIQIDVVYEHTPQTCFNIFLIKQCLINIIINSVEAMYLSGGMISVKVWHDVSGNNIMISIKDTGCGIKQDDLNRIFEPYFSTKEEQLGLGLTLVKENIKIHNGDVLVKSKPCKGTEFILVLPVVEEAISKKINNDQKFDLQKIAEGKIITDDIFYKGLEGKDISILLVDDEVQMRDIFKFIFMKKNIKLFYADNAKEALVLCEKIKFNLIFSDVCMPNMSGQEFYLNVKKMYNHDINFIFSSGFRMPDDLEKIVKDNRICFLPKPFAQKDVWEITKKILYNTI